MSILMDRGVSREGGNNLSELIELRLAIYFRHMRITRVYVHDKTNGITARR